MLEEKNRQQTLSQLSLNDKSLKNIPCYSPELLLQTFSSKLSWQRGIWSLLSRGGAVEGWGGQRAALVRRWDGMEPCPWVMPRWNNRVQGVISTRGAHDPAQLGGNWSPMSNYIHSTQLHSALLLHNQRGNPKGQQLEREVPLGQCCQARVRNIRHMTLMNKDSPECETSHI